MSARVALLDVNILVAFLWEGHEFHKAARAWVLASRQHGWATCPVTEMGCVRVMGGQTMPLGRPSVARAAQALFEFTADEKHHFWPDDLPLEDTPFASSLPHIQGPGQLTDRYLLALAAAHDGTLATFDRGLAAGLPPNSPLLAHLEVIEG